MNPDYVNGWGTRPGTNWEFSGSVQQELRPGMSANVAYYHRIFRTFEVIENTAVTPADYNPYCVTTPVDPRLPGGGGQQLCGFFDLKPGKVGLTDPLMTGASNYGSQRESWRGLDFTIDARVSNRLILQGGVSTGKAASDVCAFNDHPNITWASNVVAGELVLGQGGVYQFTGAESRISTTMCDLETPFLTQGKLLGTYNMPWDVRLSATWSNYPGPVILANAVYSSAQVQQSLGRPLSSATAVRVGVVSPHTMYADRRNQLDMRVSRGFRVGTTRIEGLVDFFNLFNGNAVTTINYEYGTNGALWQQPLSILAARLVKFGVQMTF